MNFESEFQLGQRGGNKGLPMGDGLEKLSKALNGVQKGRIYTIASPPKVGKSTFVNCAFLLAPYEYARANHLNIRFVYFSYEIDVVSMQFDLAVHYLYKRYHRKTYTLEDGKTVNGQTVIPLTSDLLRGYITDDNGDIVTLKPALTDALFEIMDKDVYPLLGKYDENGIQDPSVKCCTNFISNKQNPTGMYKYLCSLALSRGTAIADPTNPNPAFPKWLSYKPNDENEHVIVITDHCRLLMGEDNLTLKGLVDRWSQYCTTLRNVCNYTFVNIIHTNRALASIERQKYAKDLLYPGPEDIKESGNLSEDSNYVMTMFAPTDDRYNLNEFFGLTIRTSAGSPINDNLRSIHLVESRHCKYPQHFLFEMDGALKTFENARWIESNGKRIVKQVE